MRFLTAFTSLGRGTFELDGIPRMRERPIEDLLVALQQLGGKVEGKTRPGYPPVVVTGTGLKGGQVRMRASVSSQFLSAILMVAPYAESDVFIEVEGPRVSQPYIDMTIAMMRAWHLTCHVTPEGTYHIPGNQRGRLARFLVEPDATAASYFLAAAAILQGKVTIDSLTRDSIQGDIRFVAVLESMGCTVTYDDGSITLQGNRLHGIELDMNDISDTVMTLGVVACFAEGPTTIRNVAHIRYKETDRIEALATELRKIGAHVKVFADGLTITPGSHRSATLETYNDHRMAMSLALAGLVIPGITILQPGCVAKTYPNFWDVWTRTFGK